MQSNEFEPTENNGILAIFRINAHWHKATQHG